MSKNENDRLVRVQRLKSKKIISEFLPNLWKKWNINTDIVVFKFFMNFLFWGGFFFGKGQKLWNFYALQFFKMPSKKCKQWIIYCETPKIAGIFLEWDNTFCQSTGYNEQFFKVSLTISSASTQCPFCFILPLFIAIFANYLMGRRSLVGPLLWSIN